jgi:menaquinone-9 beta-reductase
VTGLGVPRPRSAPEPDRRFDVVVVGGRVSGCAMAIHLRRQGLRVAVVDRDEASSDALSTHVVQDLGLFAELGVLQDVLAAGAPPLLVNSLRVDGADISVAHPDNPWLCPRRITLDAALSSAAERAGAVMLTQASVIGLLRTGERVSGVTVQHRDGMQEHLHARVVVGADGRNSTVARMVGARKYDVVPAERTAVWSYYRGLPLPEAFFFARRGRDLVVAAPCDQGLTMVAAQPPLDDDRDWRDRALLEQVAGELVGPLRGVLRRAEPASELRSVRRMDGYFRDAAGPGWALVGDAGHFKDVVIGQGICDALRQARSLSTCLAARLLDPDRLDAELRAWWRRRDDDARPIYWLAQDMGRVQPSVLDHSLSHVLAGAPRHRRHLQEVFSRKRPVRSVVGPAVLAQALARAAVSAEVSRADLQASVMAAVRRERERRSADRRPEFMRRREAGTQQLGLQGR